jgi:hypothetical protein
MRVQQDLQVALRERYRRCLTQDFRNLAHETRMVRNWMRNQPALAAIIEQAERTEPDVDVSGWIETFPGSGLSWPSTTEEGRAALSWGLMNAVADEPDEQRAVINFGHGMSTGGGDLNDDSRALVERVYAPLFDFLNERVAQDSSVLYMLDRFVRLVEWFDRNTLHEEYTKNTRQGEAVYDRALRRFLFQEGVNMPFSQTKSASGLSDVLSDLETEDPLICEVKLFVDDKRPLAGGVHQAVLYAQDYGKSNAYLVVINLSGRPLELPTDGDEKAVPKYIDVGGVRVYLLPIRALPPATSASKAGKPNPITISRDDLTNPDA